jgi:hypothetical protein
LALVARLMLMLESAALLSDESIGLPIMTS